MKIRPLVSCLRFIALIPAFVPILCALIVLGITKAAGRVAEEAEDWVLDLWKSINCAAKFGSVHRQFRDLIEERDALKRANELLKKISSPE